jgi:hypothetical protein
MQLNTINSIREESNMLAERIMLGNLLRPSEAARLLAIAPVTLARYRKSLTEGLHYVSNGGFVYRYYSAALLHWYTHRGDAAKVQEHNIWLQKAALAGSR